MKNAVKKLKWVLIIALPVILVAAALWYFLLVDNIEQSITVEIGSSFSAEDFKRRDVDMQAQFVTDLTSLELDKPGDYPVSVSYYGRTYDCVLHMVDTVAPELTTKDVTGLAVQLPEIEDFVETLQDHTATTLSYVTPPDPQKPGVQKVTIQATDLGGNTTVAEASLNLVFDTKAPVIYGVKDMRVYVGNPVDVMEGVYAVDNLDAAPVLTWNESSVDQSVEGEYTLTYTATDLSGNKATETALMTVINDTEGPQILGVNKLSIYMGSTVSYRSGVVVRDDYDQAPVLMVDSSQVDASRAGTYDVIYTATDAAGNTTRLTTTMTIKERPSSYVDEATVYEMVDKLLAKIIKEGTTDKQKVWAIYRHVRYNYGYVSTSDKTDRIQGAYKMMKNRRGDCYNFYALSSLMFERLGIPQISVQRSAKSVRRSKHFWSMVSVDGGETYYHFDATPSSSFTYAVCLVTDATLRRLEKGGPGYFTTDPGVYPATPEKAP